MFAPPIKASKSEIAAPTALTRALKSTRHMLSRREAGISNQVMHPSAAQRAQSLPSEAGHHQKQAGSQRTASPTDLTSLAWDFSNIPILPPERASRPQLSSPLVQAKLAIGQVNDPLEQEADRIAEHLMTTPVPVPSIGGVSPRISRKCAACEAEDQAQTLQTKAATTSGPAAGYAPSAVYEAAGSSGQPLDASARAYFEPRFGHDFSRVRIHNDSAAHEAAASIDAKAYTVGSDLVFAPGQYAPHTPEGRQLLAHELTHVVQQAGGEAPRLIQRQVFRPRHPSPTPARPHRRAPYRLHGCSERDLQTPEAGKCIDKYEKLVIQNSPNVIYPECSPDGKIACCEEIPDPPHHPIVICDDPEKPTRAPPHQMPPRRGSP
jgi:Domain of unknown function (DUF4157)